MKRTIILIAVSFWVSACIESNTNNQSLNKVFNVGEIMKNSKDSIGIDLEKCTDVFEKKFDDKFIKDSIISSDLVNFDKNGYVHDLLVPKYFDINKINERDRSNMGAELLQTLLTNVVKSNDFEACEAIRKKVLESKINEFYIGQMFRSSFFTSLIIDINDRDCLSKRELHMLIVMRTILIELG